MPTLLTNLLPPERARMFWRRYFARLLVVAALMLIVIMLASAALLLPTHQYLAREVADESSTLAQLTSTQTASESELSARAETLTKNATRIQALSTATAVSPILAEVLALPRPSITLSGISYRPAGGANQGTVSLVGVAGTRTSLREYQLALQNASFVSSAELPVSAYTKDANIPFSITVILKAL